MTTRGEITKPNVSIKPILYNAKGRKLRIRMEKHIEQSIPKFYHDIIKLKLQHLYGYCVTKMNKKVVKIISLIAQFAKFSTTCRSLWNKHTPAKCVKNTHTHTPGKLSRLSIDCSPEHLLMSALDHDVCNVVEDGQQLAVDKICAREQLITSY